MKNKIFLIFIIYLLNSCSHCTIKSDLSPFETVIIFNIAERNLEFKEAQKYMDVESFYSKLGSKKPIKDWKEGSKLLYNINRSKKFTNKFFYDSYEIDEKIDNLSAIVYFKEKNRTGNIIDLKYELELRNNTWIIISMNIIKNK